MSAAPITTQVGADLYAGIEPLAYADEQLGWPLALYLDALGLILEETAQLVRADDEGNDGWSAFADPARCPTSYLYTLAQWAGVRYPRRMSTAQLRAMIEEHAPGLWRGTKSAIIAGIERYLAPGGLVFFEERADGEPYKLRIFTYAFSTLNQAAIEAELRQQIPAGLIVEYSVRIGQDYTMLAGRLANYNAVKTTYATYNAVLKAPPP